MATVTSTGGSILDVESIVSQLMAVERRPLTALQAKEASYQAKLTAFGTLKGALAQFQTSVQDLSKLGKYQASRASAADSTVASATAGSDATPGTYSLEVSQLAQAQKLVAAGQANDTAVIGSGVITFDFGAISGIGEGEDYAAPDFDGKTGKYSGASFASNGSGVKTVTIDSSNNTLAGIRDAINKANAGVTATIVNDGGNSPYRLALTIQKTGAENSLRISVADADGSTGLSALLNHDPAGTQNLSETVAAKNAEFKVDGISVTKSSNTVTDVLSGITLDLLKTNSGAATRISVTRDTASVTNAVNGFVSAYNTIMQTLKSVTAYNAETKSAAIFNGDASVRAIQTQLRGILSKAITGGGSAFATLSEIGVSVQKDGTLAADSAKLQKALTSNFDDFAGLFAAAGKTTDSLIAYSGSSGKTQPGSYAVNVTQLATQGSVAAAAAVATTTIAAGSNDTLQVKIDGVDATITLAAGNYTHATLAAEIQSKINGADEIAKAGSSVKVTESGGVLTITSDRYGSASNAAITGGNGQDNLGLGASAIAAAGLDVAGTINGKAAIGSGQTLTGAAGDASEGIKIQIAGGGTGVRGTVNYSQGYASQFDMLLTSILDKDEGPLAARTEGLDGTIKSLQKDQERLAGRLESIQARYRAQYSALDVLLSKMNSTSSYLTQQLEALANLRKQGN